jgi:hypothetical protein
MDLIYQIGNELILNGPPNLSIRLWELSVHACLPVGRAHVAIYGGQGGLNVKNNKRFINNSSDDNTSWSWLLFSNTKVSRSKK